MTKQEIEKLERIHTTLGLIHFRLGGTMTAGEEALFRRALEELFDMMETTSPSGPAPGSEWPKSLEGRWRALK